MSAPQVGTNNGNEINKPLSSCLCQNESSCEIIHMELCSMHLEVHFHANQTRFHMKGFARRLVSKKSHKVLQKWPIEFTDNLFKNIEK